MTTPAPTGSSVPDAVPPVLSIDHLSVSFQTDGAPVHAVAAATFQVEPGQILAIVGESGSGKTVSSRAVLGLLPDTAHIEGSARLTGNLELIGLKGEAMRRVRGDRIAMVFQEPSTALDPVRTVGWQICEALRAHQKLSKKAALSRAIELLDLVGIPDPAHRVHSYPHQMSGGQKQRVMIAIAIARDPEVIVADEPTTALDVTVQAQILDLLRDLRDRLGTAIILITHNMGVVADLADRVVVMYRGKIVEQATSTELFANPRHPYTRHLLAAVPHLGQPRPAAMDRVKPPPVGDDLVLDVADLCVDFPGRLGSGPIHAVQGVSLQIHSHEVLALVGESGSGKTTVGRSIVGLQQPTSGTIRVLGADVATAKPKQLRALRRRFGFVFQDPAASLNPRMSVGACISEPMRVHAEGTTAQRRARVKELLEAVELPADYAERYPHELSGGQRQRVSLARALVLAPALLVADEPTSALDVSVQAKVLELFVGLQHEMGFACLFITHDLAVVDLLADRIVVMQQGEIVEQSPWPGLLREPRQPYTQELLASVPVPDPAEQALRRSQRHSMPAGA